MLLRKGGWASLLAVCASLLASCGNEPEIGGQNVELQDAVAVSSPAALAWATQLLAGTGVEVWPMHGLGVHTGSTVPEREALVRARSAKLVVLQGARFEKWAGQTALPTSRTIRLADACKEDWIEVEEKTHAHGGQGEHTHRGVDPHTWVRPEMAFKQYRYLAQSLKETFPSHVERISSAQEERSPLFERGLRLPVPSGVHVMEHGHGFVYLVQDEAADAKAVELPEDLMKDLLDPTVELSSGILNRVRSKIGSGGSLLVVSKPIGDETRRQELQDRLRLVEVIWEPAVEHFDDANRWFGRCERELSGWESSISGLKEIREQE